jgi:cytochrome oxidase Cu insertion factor (SCO1/SenC/PrrC family)
MVTTSIINRLSQAIDRIESRAQPRQWKVVEVRRDPEEDTNMALERHFAAHPEDRDANVVIWKFFD